MKSKCLLIEARYVFQMGSSDGDPDHAQFAVAFILRDGKIRVAFDIHGDGPGVRIGRRARDRIDVHLPFASGR